MHTAQPCSEVGQELRSGDLPAWEPRLGLRGQAHCGPRGQRDEQEPATHGPILREKMRLLQSSGAASGQ